MDDRLKNNIDTNSPKNTRDKLRKNSKNNKYFLLNDLLSSKTKTTPTTTTTTTKTNSPDPQTSSPNVTCLTLLKQIFHQSSSSNVNTNNETNILTY